MAPITAPITQTKGTRIDYPPALRTIAGNNSGSKALTWHYSGNGSHLYSDREGEE